VSTSSRKSAAERREQTVRAVLKIVTEGGAGALTTSALADEIGVTSGAIFRHFESLEEILRETVTYALARFETTFPPLDLPPLQRLAQLARNRVRLLREEPGLAWLLRSEGAWLTLPKDAIARLKEMVDRSARYLLDAIREGASEGAVRRDVEPDVLLVVVMGTIHALVGMTSVHQEAVSRHADAEKPLDALVRLLAPPGEKLRIRLQRVYDGDAPPKGKAFLVDRLWPRGVASTSLKLDGWLKEVGPSDALRRWYNHDPTRWSGFVERYFAELDDHPESWRPLLDAARSRSGVTLLFAARDAEHSNAAALRSYLERQARP
jgi:uncharacterized protein YeaO (DUF488 family)/AcrR family transcriptional regulator